MPGIHSFFQFFLHNFVLEKLATSSIRDKANSNILQIEKIHLNDLASHGRVRRRLKRV